MTTYGIGNRYGLDLASLWDMLAAFPDEEGEIDLYAHKRLRFTKDNNENYYDLISNYTNEIVCMDGEVIEILYEDKDLLEIVEENTQIRFIMTRREFEIAVMC